ncbi:hypothetical protein OHR68_19100 [Spirillospora sp. NBC_00431]
MAFVVIGNGEYRTLKNTLGECGGASAEHGGYVGMDLAPPEYARVRALDAPPPTEAPVTGHGEGPSCL